MSNRTVANLIDTVFEQFDQAELAYGHGTDNAWDEAVYLVLSVTGLADDAESLQHPLADKLVGEILEMANRRVRDRQPLAYILKQAQYMGYQFDLVPGVVVPRSPIGYLLGERIQPWFEPASSSSSAPTSLSSVEQTAHRQILDLCSGSGCLGIMAAHIYPDAQVTLVEVDEVACGIAQRNIIRHNMQNRVTLVQGDVTQPWVLYDSAESGKPIKYDLIISNPPYVDAADMASLPMEFKAEPSRGLAAGDNGLSIVNCILAQAGDYLAENGILLCEVGASSPALIRSYPKLDFIWPELDLGGEGVFLLERLTLNSHTAPSS